MKKGGPTKNRSDACELSVLGNENRGADKKQIREEKELSPPEHSCKGKRVRLMEFEAGMAIDNTENAGAGNENSWKDAEMIMEIFWIDGFIDTHPN
jgi:hypothetical protein